MSRSAATPLGFPVPAGRAVVFCVLALLAGCQRVGLWTPGSDGPGPAATGASSSVPDGVYQGFIKLEGGRTNAALQVTESGRTSVDGVLQLSSDWVAEGEGTRRGPDLRLELRYGGDCPGTLTLSGRWDAALQTLTGEVHASDCTGTAQGVFSFGPSTESAFPGADLLWESSTINR